jgi:hypothetical protein
MEALNASIAALEAVIKRYEAEYETASTPAEKSELRGLINTRSQTLNRLLDEKKAATGMRS